MKHKLNRSTLLMVAGALMAASNPYFRAEYEERTERARGRKQRVNEAAITAAITRETKKTHTFTIQGHTIEAYSKKDAIKRLKHQGLLK